jgi:hypothetical protein
MSLADLSYQDGAPSISSRRRGESPARLDEYLDEARRIVAGITPAPAPAVELLAEVERLRWFLLPSEARQA